MSIYDRKSGKGSFWQERLPSTRSLAEYLQVARSTVDYAYDQLLSEGYIEARPYKGYFVCRLEGIFAMEPREENEPEPDTSGEESVPEEGCIDFSPYGIDMNGFPCGRMEADHEEYSE